MSRSILGVLVILASVVANAQDGARAGDEATEGLGVLLRNGQYENARQLIDQLTANEPRDDLKNMRALFGAAPNMRVRPGSSRFPCTVTDGVHLPVTVNGARVDWLADTGANFSLMSDSEAMRLGLELRESDGRAADLAGGSTSVRVAIAPRMVIGNTEFEEVLFLVTPADQMPWKELPSGKQGILGIPVLIALDTLRWTRAGICHTGPSALSEHRGSEAANLRYDRLQVITQAELSGKVTEFVLDTGNQAGTQLWERFAKDFAAVVKKRGRPGTARITQIGGTRDRDVVVIPDLRLKVGGKNARLSRGNVFSTPVGDERFHGLLGMDVLSQSDDVTIDFRSMRLTLR
jgi:hypothetical protein